MTIKVNESAIAAAATRSAERVEKMTRAKFHTRQTALFGQILARRGLTIIDWASARSFVDTVEPHTDEEIDSRAIYCSRTGQPIGTLSLDALSLYQKAQKAPSHAGLREEIALSYRVHPAWVRLDPDTLHTLSEIDPAGFFVYMTDQLLWRESLRYKNKLDNGRISWRTTSDQAAWTRAKIKLYAHLAALPVDALAKLGRLNTAMTAIDSELGLRHLVFPYLTPQELIGGEPVLDELLELIENYWKQYKASPSWFKREFNLFGHSANAFHRATLMRPVEKESIITQATFMEIVVADALKGTFGVAKKMREISPELESGAKKWHAERKAAAPKQSGGKTLAERLAATAAKRDEGMAALELHEEAGVTAFFKKVESDD